MVGIHHHLGTVLRACSRYLLELRHNETGAEQHGRDEYTRGAVVHLVRQSFGQRVQRIRRHLHNLNAFLSQAIDLPADRVEFAVCRDNTRSLPERQRRQEPQQQCMGVRVQGNVSGATS